MASGPLRFRTPLIEELPVTHTRQAPGFAWIAVSGPAADDPAKNWGTSNRKRATRILGAVSDSAKEASSARQRTEVEKRLRDLNTDGQAQVAIPKSASTVVIGAGGGVTKAGKTSNTKKILASGKTFAHYLDDEEAEIALRGRRDVEGEVVVVKEQRASKTPIARRKSQLQDEAQSESPAPPDVQQSTPNMTTFTMTIDDEDEDVDDLDPLPTQAEMEALLNAPPLTYNQARSAPPPASAPPPRKFCEICGYWGRVKCMKCGNVVCSVLCKDAHDEHKCLKFYA